MCVCFFSQLTSHSSAPCRRPSPHTVATHASGDMAPGGEDWPAVQLVEAHDADPAWSEKRPAGHGLHRREFGAKVPGSQATHWFTPPMDD
jgi:hypothetical protein